MRALVPLSAALAVSFIAAAPAAAFTPGQPAAASVRVHRGHGDFRDGDRFDRRHFDHRRFAREDIYAGDWYGDDAWALYNNRSWDPDSYNDWWHDRPDRAFPRWMRHNQDCQRIWWSGGGWRC